MISLRKWQRFLPPTTDTRLSLWFQTSFQEVVSLLPLYMDRVRAFSGPLYGFDTVPMFQDNATLRHDWDDAVQAFLKKQDKVGGPPTAVAIVLDAQSTCNLHVERGFWLAATSNAAEEKSPEELGARVLWPAVYLRSTLHLAAATAEALSKKHHGSRSSLLPSWTSDNSLRSKPGLRPSDVSLRNKPGLRPSELAQANTNHWHVMEYGPDEGRVVNSWPHSEWDSLMVLLDNKSSGTDASDLPLSREDAAKVSQSRLAEEPVAVTYIDMGEDEDAKTSLDSIFLTEEEPAASLFSTGLDMPLSPQTPPQNSNQQSTFHVVSLSAFLSMVVVVKGEEESRWGRKRYRLADEQIRHFLDVMASKLRIANLFAPSRLPQGADSSSLRQQPRLKPLADDMIGWTDENVKTFLKELKGTFGLRPANPLQESLRMSSSRSRRTLSPSTTPGGSRRRRKWRSTRPAMNESATAFFLGPNLAALVSDD
jgi:hypothetical protein